MNNGWLGLLCLVLGISAAPAWADDIVTHPPLRPLAEPTDRPLPDGPRYYVDADAGNDAHDGSRERPWHTIGHALGRLEAGDTLVLREGTYYEHVRISVVGEADAPITIRSHPGELAVIDGGRREFFESPGDAWEAYDGEDAGEGEFISTRSYRNLRDVVGAFGDSMVGLQTYWHAKDLRAENELWYTPEGEHDVAPIYSGPGLWYNPKTGRIHARLAHTHVPRTVRLDYPGFDSEASNYTGVTDPREVPMVIAPFRSVPLHVDHARHVRLQDLVIRGGGYDTVKLDFPVNLEFDNVIIHCGTYGLRAKSAVGVRFHRSALRGNATPWQFRTENGLRAYRRYDLEGRGHREIARLSAHGLLVTEGAEQSSVFYYPPNMHWKISYSEFTDGNNGVFLTGHNMRFHHNLIDQIYDDAMFLSTPSPNYTDSVYIHHNLLTRVLMGFSLNDQMPTQGTVWLYRNVVDMREGVNRGRPTPENPEGTITSIRPFKVSRDIESMFIYQNTFLLATSGGVNYAGWAMGATGGNEPRRVFNNIFLYMDGYPGHRGIASSGEHNAVIDHSLHFSPGREPPEDYLERITRSEASQGAAELHSNGWEANSLIADPGFVRFDVDDPRPGRTDYRLASDSPARGAGMVLPEDWPDPQRPADGATPDLGALPVDAAPLRVGRDAAPDVCPDYQPLYPPTD